MTISELGSLGELVAAIATVLTLLYLASQIRGNTKATRAETSLSINEALAVNLSALRSDAEFSEIWLRGLSRLLKLGVV